MRQAEKVDLGSDDWTMEIRPYASAFHFPIKELWEYRDLLFLFVRRDFKTMYKQTILGPAWILLSPLLTTGMFSLIFGRIAGISTDGTPAFLFYMAGNILWNYFSSCLSAASSTFIGNAGLFGKVYFPRLTTPISNVLTSIVTFLIQMVVVLIFLMFYIINGSVMPNLQICFTIPIILIQLGIMGMGIGIIVSSLTTKYRDLSVLVTFGIQLWMYITPVVYPLSQAGIGKLRYILLINPVTTPIELFRCGILGKGEVEITYLIWSWIFTIIVAVAGIMIFNKVERTFMDTV